MRPSVPLAHRHQFWDALLGIAFSALFVAGIIGTASGASAVQRAAGALCLLGAACVVYGVFVEPKRIIVRRHPLPLPEHDRLRIAVASDFHVGPLKDGRFVARAVERINAQAPDVILLPGDFLYDEWSDVRELDPLGKLRASGGVFAVIGNHDSGNYLDMRHRPFSATDRSGDVARFLEDRGIRVLRNSIATISPHGRPLAIAGIDDLWPTVPAGVHETLERIDSSVPTILLSHHPDVIRLPGMEKARLIISAHTHGGQLRLPFIGPLLPIPSSLGRRYDRGFFRVGPHTRLFITHGLGETLMRARFFATPEIVVLENS